MQLACSCLRKTIITIKKKEKETTGCGKTANNNNDYQQTLFPDKQPSAVVPKQRYKTLYGYTSWRSLLSFELHTLLYRIIMPTASRKKKLKLLTSSESDGSSSDADPAAGVDARASAKELLASLQAGFASIAHVGFVHAR